jgi:hypothetical protein
MDIHIIQFRNGCCSVCFSRPLKIGLYKTTVLTLFCMNDKYRSLTNVTDKTLIKM